MIPGLGKSPGEGKGYPLHYSCLENPHGQRSLGGYSPQGVKESDTTQRLSTAQHSEYKDVPGGSDGKESTCNAGDSGLIPELGRSLEKGKATHASILGWRSPWTEEPGGLQPMGSQRVRHD